MIPWGQNIFY